MKENNMLTKKEVCDTLRISISTLNSLLKEKKIGCVRVGTRAVRIPPEELDKFIKTRTKEGTA
jgi:excisionase family DNA binding protein